MAKGKLIVIDGADGSGKHTQTELALQELNNMKYLTQTIDFPQYEQNFFGRLIGQFQTMEELDFSKIHPMLASIPYACDRWQSKPLIETWLNKGTNVICDRYVSANQLHQGGKIKDEQQRVEFLKYLEEMEYGVFKLPRPDKIILLDVPHAISIELMKEKSSGDKKQYSQRKTDFVELDAQYQLDAREAGIKMLSDESWIRITCSEDGKTILSREKIHEMVMAECLKTLIGK